MRSFSVSAFACVLGCFAFVAGACGDVPVDDAREDARFFPARGVIRGTVTYVGPRPCSRDGHIVGNALVFAFNRRNLPPPDGFGGASDNFVAVPGDVLFRNEPRSTSRELYCPPSTPAITASAPFTVAPVEAGDYQISSFYDRRGRFYPSFSFRNMPEAGDIAGGCIDLDEARTHAVAAGQANRPVFLPVRVGVADASSAATESSLVVPPNGFVADNIAVTLASVVPLARPVFYPQGSERVGRAEASPANPTGNALAVPVLAIRQDVKTLAMPANATEATDAALAAYQSSVPTLRLMAGVAPNEFATAVDPAGPFDLQLSQRGTTRTGELAVFARGTNLAAFLNVAELWPRVVFVKLADDPLRRADPQSLVLQGTPQESAVTGAPMRPLVVLEGVTLLDDSLVRTLRGPTPVAPVFVDHVTALVRPVATCFDPRNLVAGAIVVTPHLSTIGAQGASSGDNPRGETTSLAGQPGVRNVMRGCLPLGRYAMMMTYPTGQVWRVPNELGGCALSEGAFVQGAGVGSCTAKPRPVLLSQGARAVIEVIEPQEPALCNQFAVPRACLQL